MGSFLFNDWHEIDPAIQYHHIITDPPYDGEFNLAYWRLHCRGNIIVFCKPENQFFKADEYLFWTKTPSTKNFINKCGRFVEIILVSRGCNTFNPLHWSQMIGTYDDRLITKTEHPYEKPLALMERLVHLYTNPGDIILDPFMGSGTTGVAAINQGRQFIGAEIVPEYHAIAERKIRHALARCV